MRMSLAPYVSIAALGLCSLLVLNWRHSYDYGENSSRVDGGVITSVSSHQGVLQFVQMETAPFWRSPDHEWQHHSYKAKPRRGGEYFFEWDLRKKVVIVPYRAVVPLVALIGIAPWIRSKRTLVEAVLIATPHIPAIIARLH
jgi:hypothetical protein